MRKKNVLNQVMLIVFFSILCILVIIPFLMLVSVSFSDEKDIVNYGYALFPKNISLEGYKFVFENPKTIIDAYKVTIIFSVAATFLGVLLMAMCAFPLSQKKVRGRKAVSFYLFFTMLFNGGMVPSYILITQYLHLTDSIWVYIIPGLISPWSIFMIRTFFSGLPEEIFESMDLDGANVYDMFFLTAIPLSKPVIATIALTTFLGKWNDWSTSMLYINKPELYSLQYMLQRMMNNIKMIQEMSMTPMENSMYTEVPSETVRMAMAVVAAGPALVIFPFFQKYFVKGLTVGSVKG